MKDTDYAFCVAVLRANERKLLTAQDIDALIDCGDYDKAVAMLKEKGMAQGESISQIILNENKKLWELLSQCVPDKSELSVLCLVNDFFNIKAAVKCHFTGGDASGLYAYPTTLDTAALTEAINSHSFERLASPMGECAKESYQAACLTENGQNADIIVDAAALKALAEYARKNKDTLAGEICAFICDTANIKTALRCAATGKGRDFAEKAIGECVSLERSRLVSLALEGEKPLYAYLGKTTYKQLSEAYGRDSAEYEKICDDYITALIKKAKLTAFGFDPVCAYYYAKTAEIKNIRVILTSLRAGADKQIVRERVRALYV